MDQSPIPQLVLPRSTPLWIQKPWAVPGRIPDSPLIQAVRGSSVCEGNRRGMTRYDPFKGQRRAISLSVAKMAFQTAGERMWHDKHSC